MKKLVFTICMLILTLNATDTNQDDFGIIDIDYESRSMMLNMIKKKYFEIKCLDFFNILESFRKVW